MSVFCEFNFFLKALMRYRGRVAFLRTMPFGSTLLDVGCGSNSPARLKGQRPDIHYTGLDIADYNHTRPPQDFADCYILVSPASFSAEIEKFRGQFDAIVSSHNLEHCLEPERVLCAISGALREGGRLYLSFPCEESVRFPKRAGTLNFSDDPTHRQVPNFKCVLDILVANQMRLDFVRKRYRPPLLFLVGLILEPFSALLGRTMPGLSTWALYGFESVVWATREVKKA